MGNDPILGVLGLSLRAGKLACGDEQVRALCEDKKARCVFVAGDAGSSTSKKAAQYAGRADIPCVTLPQNKESLGAALGKAGCAVCALSDIGLAASVAQKLALEDEAYAADAERLAVKNMRIQSRRGKKKKNVDAAEHNGEPRRGSRKPSSRTGQGWHKGR